MEYVTKKITIVSTGVFLSCIAVTAEAALSSSALLAFDAGYQTCSIDGYSCTVSGSYFGVDLQGDGAFDNPGDLIPISAGSDGGLLIGRSQLASGSHSGAPDVSEVAPLDAAWSFLGNTGMHQTTSPVNILSDNGAGTVELDFSGISATWNVVQSSNLGGDSANYPAENGIATLLCGFDCSLGDSFVLDYIAHVPLDDPSGFGGVPWKIHLEGTVSVVPVPAAVWLFGSGLIAMVGLARRKQS